MMSWLAQTKQTNSGESCWKLLVETPGPGFVSQIIDALGSTRDESLKQLYVDYLARYLRLLKDSNRVVYAALLALREIGEPVNERGPDGASSQSLIDVDRNIRQAHKYLEKHQIIVPW